MRNRVPPPPPTISFNIAYTGGKYSFGGKVRQYHKLLIFKGNLLETRT